MTFLDNLGAALGFGALTLEIEPQGTRHFRGEPMYCVLRVRGGKVPQTILALSAILRNYRSDGKNVYLTVLNDAHLGENMTIAPGEVREFPVAFPLQDYASLTRKHVAGVQVDAAARIARGRARHGSAVLYVVPEREFFVVGEAMNSLGFSVHSPFEETPKGNGILRAVFDVRPELQAQAQRLELFLACRGRHMEGKLVLHRSPASVGEFLKTNVLRQQQSVSFDIERADLLMPNKQANMAVALHTLRDILSQVLILPEHESGWMLRASSSPIEDSDELLRPAESASPTDPAELLRPMEEKNTV